MSTAILATEATLNTLQVTIQSLTVKGKQMTLAVFRQLPMTDALDEQGNVRALAWWGWVNYKIKDEGDAWAVCESKGYLFRAPLQWPGQLEERADKWTSWLEDAREQEKKGWRVKDKVEEAERMVARAPYWRNSAKSYRALFALPQLFIAV